MQTNVTSGSYFAFDLTDIGVINETEKVAITGTGTAGIVIGKAMSPGAHRSGPPLAGDTNEIDVP